MDQSNWEICHFERHACAELPHIIIAGVQPDELRSFWRVHGIRFIVCTMVDEMMLNESVTLRDTTILTVFVDDADLTAAKFVL